MSLAVTFPGQGSQAVGMGQALIEASSAAKAVFDEVDEALGEKLSSVILEGPEETLTLTANAQPALMAVSIAAMRSLEEKGFSLKESAAYVAGHSLGEYSNDNGGGQLVISGSKAAVEKAAGLASEKGAKRALLLPVSAPFHSALMSPAADAMAEALSVVTMNAPCVPLVANVLARPTSDPDEIRSRLVEQVTGQVRWRESIEWMGANGVTNLMEVGSGKVLSGLARRINRDLASVAVGNPDDIEKALEAHSA